MKKALKAIGRDVWFNITLLTGKADERTIENVNQDALGFALLAIATLASLLILFVLTAICITFEIG